MSARSGLCMQSVDVLSKDHQQFSGAFQFHYRFMNCIWGRAAKDLPAFHLVIPVFYSRCFRIHKIFVVNWFAPSPDTLRTTEIGDTTRSRNAGTRKNQDPV